MLGVNESFTFSINLMVIVHMVISYIPSRSSFFGAFHTRQGLCIPRVILTSQKIILVDMIICWWQTFCKEIRNSVFQVRAFEIFELLDRLLSGLGVFFIIKKGRANELIGKLIQMFFFPLRPMTPLYPTYNSHSNTPPPTA